MFLGKAVRKICSKFTGEHPRGISPVNLLHIFRTLFPKNTSGGLLLQVYSSAGESTFYSDLFSKWA